MIWGETPTIFGSTPIYLPTVKQGCGTAPVADAWNPFWPVRTPVEPNFSYKSFYQLKMTVAWGHIRTATQVSLDFSSWNIDL